jgi:hypothetical protein
MGLPRDSSHGIIFAACPVITRVLYFKPAKKFLARSKRNARLIKANHLKGWDAKPLT